MKIADPLAYKLRSSQYQLNIHYAMEQGDRPRQEDACVVFGDECVALADGMGDKPHGDVASLLAAETAAWAYRHVRQRPFYWDDKKKFMHRIFRTCNLTIWQKQREVGFQDGMATTLSVLMVNPQYFWIGTAGDTAGYLAHRGNVRQLTPPNKNALGLKRLGLVPEFTSGKLESGDTLLLATDGVWEYVTMDDLTLALEEEDLAVAAHVLLDAARIAGSTDNRSVAVIRTTGVS